MLFGTHYSIEDFFSDPKVLIAFGLIIVSGIMLPFCTLFLYRMWRQLQWKINGQQPAKIQQDEGGLKSTSIFNIILDVVGYFNSNIIENIRYNKKEKTNGKNKVKFDVIEKSQLENEETPDGKEEEKEEEKEKEEIEKKKEENDIFINKKNFAVEQKKPFNKTMINSTNTLPNLVPEENEETAKALKILSENGLHGKLATAQLHARTLKMEKEMSDLEREKEREIRNEQLNSIFQMMKDQGEKFGMDDKNELMEQMKLYSI